MTRPIRDDLERRLSLAAAPEAKAIFTRLLPETARAEADAADARRRAGISLGPLDGKIVSVKDLFDMAGHVTTAGSTLLRDQPPASADAPAVARVRRAGAVIIGRTNMTEFAFSGLGLNPHYGTPPSARAADRIPGGSTSGGAASVARGIADVTLGSDTGGSTRIPAAFNGIVGFKPTSNRIPKDGAFPLSYALDSVGPLGGDVGICAATDAIMAGEEPSPLPEASLTGLRVAVPRGFLMTQTEAPVASAFEAALARISGAGAAVSDLDIDDLLARMRETLAGAPIVAAESAAIHAAWLQSKADAFDPRVRARIEIGKSVSAAAYVNALRARASLRCELLGRIAMPDIIALPTVAVEPPLLAPLEKDDALFSATNLLVLRNTTVANFFDLPAISLPLPTSGLPVGLMLMGKPGEDRRLFAIASAVMRLK